MKESYKTLQRKTIGIATKKRKTEKTKKWAIFANTQHESNIYSNEPEQIHFARITKWDGKVIVSLSVFVMKRVELHIDKIPNRDSIGWSKRQGYHRITKWNVATFALFGQHELFDGLRYVLVWVCCLDMSAGMTNHRLRASKWHEKQTTNDWYELTYPFNYGRQNDQNNNQHCSKMGGGKR